MKSHASDLTELAICIYKDAVAKSTANEPDRRDILRIISRVKHEGLSFLTITLPTFGEDFENCLRQEVLDPTLFRCFKKRGRAPAFLQGFLGLVFDIGTGRILDEPNVAAIEGIRQIAYSFKKLGLPCEANRIRKAFRKFIQDELDLSCPLAPTNNNDFLVISANLWSSVLGRDVCPNTFIPRHGPGATAEGISGNGKYQFRSWNERLEPYFPMFDNAYATAMAFGTKEYKDLTLVSLDQELPVKVITVPKTLKSPRIIAIEPVCMQYTQQGVSRYLMDILETSVFTSGHINFKSQEVNQKLAINSSKTRKMATLDLSSASDRVPYHLVKEMFSSCPNLWASIDASRSRSAKLPTGEVIHLKKFASMGSALCFPIESMYFYTLCIAALIEKHNLPVTLQNIYKMSRSVYIYGDDIIVPANDAVAVINYLQKYYCKVNMSKSFWTGKFRESCGMEAFDGHIVVPTYVRTVPPDNRRNAPELISWTKASNLFYKRGYWLTSNFLIKKVETILGVLPIVGERCAGLGKSCFQAAVSVKRWRKRYQRFEVKAWCPEPVYRQDKLDGYPALLKSLLRLGEDFEAAFFGLDDVSKQLLRVAAADPKHLERSARYGAVRLKSRWVEPY